LLREVGREGTVLIGFGRFFCVEARRGFAFGLSAAESALILGDDAPLFFPPRPLFASLVSVTPRLVPPLMVVVGPDCSLRFSPWREERDEEERAFERLDRFEPAEDGRDTVEGGASVSAGALGDGAKPVEGVDMSTCGMCEDRSGVDGPC